MTCVANIYAESVELHSPGLPRQRQPWVVAGINAINPERVAQATPRDAAPANSVQPFQGCDRSFGHYPRVAAARQPWALECDPFRVGSLGDRNHPHRGLVLIVVLIVLALLSLAAWTFSELMLAENTSALYSGRRLQARAFAESGVEMSIWFLTQDADSQQTFGGHYDNAGYFSNRIVGEAADGLDPGRFTISTPAYDDDGARAADRYGLVDESGKINLNAILAADDAVENGGRDLLVAALGDIGMKDYLADRILDFIDPDDQPREQGAEANSYTKIKPKNGPLESLEELLLVDGVDWRLLFGADLNRNGRIDPDEQDGALYDDLGEQGQRGWSGFLTIHSAEKNLNPDGEPKIDLNNNDMEALYEELSAAFDAEWATYIVAYRQNGAATGDVSGMSPQTRTGGLDFEQTGRARLTTVLDLVGVNVSATTFKGEEQAVLLKSPFPDPAKDSSGGAALAKLLDYAAVNTAPVIGGRINVNEAPKVVLQALPGLSEARRDEIVNAILTQRDPTVTGSQSPYRHETWLLERRIVTLDEMKLLMPFVCAGGAIYRADVLGYFDAEASGQIVGPSVRLEVVIDATRDKPRLLFWRDISHLGTRAVLEAVAGQ